MPSLKDLRDRIKSVQNTRKITTAMKLVAAAKLRKAQEQAEAGRPYAMRMNAMLGALAAGSTSDNPLLAGTGSDNVHLIVLATADRGLCGGFNANLIKDAVKLAVELTAQGKTVKFYTLGRKGAQALKRTYENSIVKGVTELDKPKLDFGKAEGVGQDLLRMYADGEFDVATLIYAKFKSAIEQDVTRLQLMPFAVEAVAGDDEAEATAGADSDAGSDSAYEYEPDEETVLDYLLPRNVSVQIYNGLLENAASEHGARMTAMDNATRNSGEMINDLNLVYNRSRQAQITKELIEIVSGAEAL